MEDWTWSTSAAFTRCCFISKHEAHLILHRQPGDYIIIGGGEFNGIGGLNGLKAAVNSGVVPLWVCIPLLHIFVVLSARLQY